MGIITRWDDKQQTIVLLEFETSWTLDDLKQAVQEADALIGSVDHRVDLLIDIEDSRMPSDFMGMARVLLAEGEARANEGRRVVVGASVMFRQATTPSRQPSVANWKAARSALRQIGMKRGPSCAACAAEAQRRARCSLLST